MPSRASLNETWMLENRPENAIRILSRLVARRSSEVTPAALGRLAAVAQRLRAPEVARIANERLRRDYPRSRTGTFLNFMASGPTEASPRCECP